MWDSMWSRFAGCWGCGGTVGRMKRTGPRLSISHVSASQLPKKGRNRALVTVIGV